MDKDSYQYCKGYLDGLNDAKPSAFKDVIELIEGGFVTDLNDLKSNIFVMLEKHRFEKTDLI